MVLDIFIILTYFVVIFTLGIVKRDDKKTTAHEYFLKSNTLRWPAIAFSTISTNIHAGHFIGMAGSAYLYGLVQANFEINAILGILIAAFVFIPIYLAANVTTISQFFEQRLGLKVAFTYSILMILLYGFLYLGTALFWGAYAINAIFEEEIRFIHHDPMIRIFIIAIMLGAFSAVYTYLGGMGAVVRTDIAQFVLMVMGGVILVAIVISELGGWAMLYEKTPNLMHLHMPSDHPKLPWPALLGMMLLNLNYWGCNQIILQRALAAKNIYHAQVGLIVGGFLKYLMVLIIIIPGIALVGILSNQPLSDPDLAYPTLIIDLLPKGLKGIILCSLFASLMSSVDSIFHSVSTLWSVDIYKKYINPGATDSEMVSMGRKGILGALCTGLLFAYVVIYVKFENPTFALTHWFNEASYYIKNGFVFLIVCAVFLISASKKLVLHTLIGSVGLTILLKWLAPDMNYLNRSTLIIVAAILVVAIPTIIQNGWPQGWGKLLNISTKKVGVFGWLLLGSLVLCHVVFH